MPLINSVGLNSVPFANNGAVVKLAQAFPSKRCSVTWAPAVTGAAMTITLNDVRAFAEVGAVMLSLGLIVTDISELKPAPRSQLPSLVTRNFPDLAK